MIIDGVSNNRVEKIVEKLEDRYVYLFSDASYFYIRENNQVVKRLLLIRIDTNDYRKILGVNMALEESSSTWTKHFTALKERRLKTIGLTISDAHKGLVKAQEEEFPGTPHQRCMVHWERNLLFRVENQRKKRIGQIHKTDLYFS